MQTFFGVPQKLGSFAGTTALLAGDAGTAQTVSLAKKLVDAAVKDPAVNALAVAIVRPTANYDNLAKAEAVYDWVQANVRYVQDPVGPYGAKETLRPMRDLMVLLAGDCDDINMVFIPSLLGTLGYSSRVVTIKADRETPHEYSHVYCEALIDGEWVPMDCARPGAMFGEEPPYYWGRKDWPMADAPITLMGMCAEGSCGCGCGRASSALNGMSRGLAGYVLDMPGGMGRLGDDSTTAQDISAATSGAAAVISAANQNPYSYLYTVNAGAPGNVAPQLGYGGIGASVNFSSYLPLIIGGVILLALVGGGRR